MPTVTFHLPDLGEGLSEAEIVEWHVAVGDEVRSGQPLLAVETDKAVVDIPSPRTARIAALHGAPGDMVPVGAALVEFASGAADTGAVVGRLSEQPELESVAVSPARNLEERHVRATPKARRRARELGIALEQVVPMGDIIQVDDVERAAAPATAAPQPTIAAGKEEAAAARLKGVRRAMAIRMADAHARVVPASVTDEADISAWTATQKPLPRLVRALIHGCRLEPRLNASFDDEVLALTPREEVNVGVAMETEDGLFVPVLRNAAARSLEDLAAELQSLQERVENRSISPEDLRGQTITLSNFGAVAGLHAQMVVVPPQVAILGAGRIFSRLTLHQGLPGTARILPLSLTIDHRAITGVEACRFLAAVIDDLQSAH